MDLVYRRYKRNGHFCSKGENGRICNGDSGGPLFCNSGNKESVILEPKILLKLNSLTNNYQFKSKFQFTRRSIFEVKL